MTREAKVLIYDLETSPIIGYTWGTYQTDVIRVIQHSHLLCFSYKWLGEKRVHNMALPDFPRYRRDRTDDKDLVAALHALFTEADVLVAHNGDRYDQRYASAMFIKHGMKPPEPYLTVDTLKVARKHFKFTSNRLNDLGSFLGLGEKAKHDGFDTWVGCLAGDEKAWRKMRRYNNRDVTLLEQVYLTLRPWIANHPPVNSITEDPSVCPKCGSDKLQHRGFAVTKASRRQRFVCQGCGGWCLGRNLEPLKNKVIN